MGVNPDAGSHNEIFSARSSLEIGLLNPAQRHTPRRSVQGDPGRSSQVTRKAQVMRQSVSGAHGQNRQGHGRIRQHLCNVVDGSVATAGKDRIAAGGDRSSSRFAAVTASFRRN